MPNIRFYNTLTHRTEPFEPIEPGLVTMYNCGPTVYDFAHIGNFRAFLFADVLRRFLEFSGFKVRQVMNITDVGHMTDDAAADGGGEDKMALAVQRVQAAKKAGSVPPDAVTDPYQVAAYYTRAFEEDARALGLKIVDDPRERMPRATDHVEPSMVPMIQRLLASGHAYRAGDAVYFSVESFPDYGRLSGNTLDQLRGGAGGRTQAAHQAEKRHPADFLLWKNDASHLMKWDTPLGLGYPGWHIECSAMARAVLGREVIDIHTGGEDNIFPHHECEIAQSRGDTGRERFANYWLHTRYLMVDGQKMSKSRGSFYTVRDVLGGKVTGRPVDPRVLRLELTRAHYRSNVNFTAEGLSASASALRKLLDLRSGLIERGAEDRGDPGSGFDHPVVEAFAEALGDDLNMSGALGAVFAWAGDPHADPQVALDVLRRVDAVLGVLPPAEAGSGEEPSDADRPAEACRAIDAAREAKDFAEADRLRAELIEAGYEVKTTPQGTVATPKLA